MIMPVGYGKEYKTREVGRNTKTYVWKKLRAYNTIVIQNHIGYQFVWEF